VICSSHLPRLLVVLLVALVLAGCAGTQDPTRGWSASQFYSEAKNALNEGNYDQAIEYYELLEARFPFGRYAQQAQIEIPFAYYKAGEPEPALAAVDRFIEMNPRHPNLDYAYYLRGLVNFNRQHGFLSRLLPRDPAQMDPEPFDQAFRDFQQLIQEFPDSAYAPDARQRMVFIRNTLAAYQVQIAEFYMERTAWVAAAERARNAITTYPGAEITPKALAVLVRAYRELGLDDHAENTMTVLELNYPDTAAAVRAGRPVEAGETERGGLWTVLEHIPFLTN